MFDLKSFRRELRLTQSELTQVLNVTQSYISRIESNDYDMPNSYIEILKERFGEEIVEKYIIESQSTDIAPIDDDKNSHLMDRLFTIIDRQQNTIDSLTKSLDNLKESFEKLKDSLK